MRMLVNVGNHTDAELDHRIRHGKRLIEASEQRSKEESDKGNINAAIMHQSYALYIRSCIDQSQNELDRRRT